jgi:hypothetical protein
MAETREFIDRLGIRWRVSEIAAHQGPPLGRERRKFERMPRSDRNAGSNMAIRAPNLSWLRFESQSDSRTLSPAPADWATLDDLALEDLLATSKRMDGA